MSEVHVFDAAKVGGCHVMVQRRILKRFFFFKKKNSDGESVTSRYVVVVLNCL